MNGSGRYLPPKLIQAVGVAIIVGGLIFWAVTGQQSALFVGAGISLVGLGAYSGLKIDVTAAPPPKEPPVEEPVP
jgi:hypothetical protein